MTTSLTIADLTMEYLASSHTHLRPAAPAPDTAPLKPERVSPGTLTSEQLKDAIAQMVG